MYIDLLDSAKSGHPIGADTKTEWWRAKDPKKQQEAISLAHAALLMRLLYGDTIVLPSNQAIDSVAWLKAAAYLPNASENLEQPVITWAAFRIDKPTPDSFLETAIEAFKPKPTAGQFKLSAWPTIDDKIRTTIANNLKNKRSFANMFDDIKYDIDSSIRASFEEQQYGLINFHKYLEKYYSPKDENYYQWDWENPRAIKKSREPKDNPRKIWQDLLRTKGKLQGIPGDILEDIRKKLIKDADGKENPENLEIRSALYSAIEGEPAKLRTRIRKLIDLYYNKKNAVSVTDGYGLMSILDQDINTPVEEDQTLMDFAEKADGDDEEDGKAALYFLPGKFPELSALTLEECMNILSDPKVRNSIKALRHLFVTKPGRDQDPVASSSYREWSKDFHHKLNLHQDLLTKKLPGKVKLENERLVALMPSALFGAAGSGLAAGVVSYFNLPPSSEMAIVSFSTFIASMLPVLAEKIDPKNIPTSAAARINKKISGSITRNFF